jgi:hypothetical protein
LNFFARINTEQKFRASITSHARLIFPALFLRAIFLPVPARSTRLRVQTRRGEEHAAGALSEMNAEKPAG